MPPFEKEGFALLVPIQVDGRSCTSSARSESNGLEFYFVKADGSRRHLERPTLTRSGLKELQIMDVQLIGELDERFTRG